MTLEMARLLALATLESKAAENAARRGALSFAKYRDYSDAITVLKADFANRPAVSGYSDEHCHQCGENIRVSKVHTLLPSGACREDRKPQAQDSVTDQLARSICVLNNEGLYDAADHIAMLLKHSGSLRK